MFAQVFRPLFVGSSLLLAVLLSACSHDVGQTKTQEETVTVVTQDTNGLSSMSLSEAAMAVPQTEADDAHHSTISNKQLKQFAGRYTGTMPCVATNKACSEGNMDVTLTLFPDGSAVRTLAQQGKVNAMLEKETAEWQISADGKTISVTLPGEHQLTFKLLPNHQLQFDHAAPSAAAITPSIEDDDSLLNVLKDQDMHERGYMLTMQ